MPRQDLGGLHSGQMATIVKGDTLKRSMGQYGKDDNFTGDKFAKKTPPSAGSYPKLIPDTDGDGA